MGVSAGGGTRSGPTTTGHSMARAPPGLMAASLLLLLLLLCSATTAAPPTPPPSHPPGPLTHLRGYLGQVGSAAENLLERLSLPAAQQRIRVAYEQGSAAVVTYTGILTDQLYHWWQGDH
ncbi:apolipoprotein C-II [Chiroxiphia lanceolata]|uniref:apolipoprotein C-II n=1 Tax=Chiroxiphia lanceolata TaxID=296741 RepID=UPI0013CEF3DC|nr:apolipoprotein C-II [Chiroxiphia lanceolata]